MDTKPEGDHSVEVLLRRSLRSATDAAVTDACLDAETIATWADGALSRHDRALAEAHTAGCARCQATVAALMKASPEPPASERWWLRGWNVRWLVPLTAGAIAVAFWFAVPSPRNADLSDNTVARSRGDESAKPAEPAGLARSDSPLVEGQKPAPAEIRPQPQETVAVARLEQLRAPATAAPLAQRQEPAPAPARPDSNESKEERERTTPAAPSQPKPADALEKVAPAAAATAAVVAGNTAQSSVGRRDQAAALSQAAVTPVREIQSPDTSVRWRFGAGGLVQYSVDRGATWEAPSTDVVADLTAGAAPSSSVCWLVGRAGTVLLSTDGRRFVRVPFPEAADLTAVRATDARTATVTTADGRTFTTTNGGATWTATPR